MATLTSNQTDLNLIEYCRGKLQHVAETVSLYLELSEGICPQEQYVIMCRVLFYLGKNITLYASTYFEHDIIIVWRILSNT